MIGEDLRHLLLALKAEIPTPLGFHHNFTLAEDTRLRLSVHYRDRWHTIFFDPDDSSKPAEQLAAEIKAALTTR